MHYFSVVCSCVYVTSIMVSPYVCAVYLYVQVVPSFTVKRFVYLKPFYAFRLTNLGPK